MFGQKKKRQGEMYKREIKSSELTEYSLDHLT